MKKPNKALTIKSTKMAARFVVANSVKAVVSAIIVKNVPVESKKQQLQLAVGSYVIGGMVADAGKSSISSQIDNAVKIIEKIQAMNAEPKDAPTK